MPKLFLNNNKKFLSQIKSFFSCGRPIFSNNNKKFLSQIDKSEKELSKFICENWKDLFPNYDFISMEDQNSSNPVAETQQHGPQLEFEKVLNTLTPRETEIIRLRYGIGIGYPRTLEEVGKKFGVTRERVRQIEAKAIRKLRYPRRSKLLREYVEFILEGNVRSNLGTNNRIDILGFNPKTKRFIIFELKKDYDRNIADQTADYRDYIQRNFFEAYLLATEKYKLPVYKHLYRDPEIILIAKKFSTVQIERAKKNNITLIKYYWFENDLIFIDYLNNDPDDGKIETADTKNKGINKIKNIDSSEKGVQDEIDKFFEEKNQSKAAFIIFLKFLESNGQVNLNFNKLYIRIEFNNATFSVISRSGKGVRKVVLLVITNIDVTALSKQIIVDDGYRGEDTKVKGSWGTERFKVYFRNEDEIKEFCKYIKDKDFQPFLVMDTFSG